MSWRASLLLVLVTLPPGCAMSFGGAREHRPAIQAELEPQRPASTYRSTWSPDSRLMERAILESVRDGGSPRDDSPTWMGPARTAGASATGERPGVSSRVELDSRQKEREERVARRVEQDNKAPDPRPADVERTLDLWEQLKADRGFAPIDLDPKPKPPPPVGEKKGP